MNPWLTIRPFTKARIGLGQSGASVPTATHLELRLAEAHARDALWKEWDYEATALRLESLGWPCGVAFSQVKDRQSYLARPDLGRALTEGSFDELSSLAKTAAKTFDPRIAFCVSDGLSALAIETHVLPFFEALQAALAQETFYEGLPYRVTLIPYGRVAISDAIGEALGAEIAVILVGERPGLSAHDSMGLYLTYHPERGTSDGARNCLSNIRPPDGMPYAMAADQLCFLLRESLARKLSGVALKMEERAKPQILPEKIIKSLS